MINYLFIYLQVNYLVEYAVKSGKWQSLENLSKTLSSEL